MAEVHSQKLEKLQNLRGMVDLLPAETSIWQAIENTAQQHFKRASIKEIRTPLLETTELFSRGIGESTDVVGKEMYSFTDRGDRSCTLRPEGTAPVVRAAIQHHLLSKGSQKLWYSGPMFRYERPQAGRQRQFHQIGVEYLGFKDPKSDVEAISLAWDLLKDLGLKNLNLELNTLGDFNDRKEYQKALICWLKNHRDKLDDDSQNRINVNPLRILDSKNIDTKKLLLNAPQISDYISEENINRFEKIKLCLDRLDIPYTLNPMLVRGLDYYTHTAFEITSTQLGAQSTVCGGGRYDNLIEQLGGDFTPAFGWGLGMERLILLLTETYTQTIQKNIDIYLINKGDEADLWALQVSRQLRLMGLTIESDLSGASFSKQLKRADKSGAKFAILIGDTEARERGVILKDLRISKQQATNEERISLKMLIQRFA